MYRPVRLSIIGLKYSGLKRIRQSATKNGSPVSTIPESRPCAVSTRTSRELEALADGVADVVEHLREVAAHLLRDHHPGGEDGQVGIFHALGQILERLEDPNLPILTTGVV